MAEVKLLLWPPDIPVGCGVHLRCNWALKPRAFNPRGQKFQPAILARPCPLFLSLYGRLNSIICCLYVE